MVFLLLLPETQKRGAEIQIFSLENNLRPQSHGPSRPHPWQRLEPRAASAAPLLLQNCSQHRGFSGSLPRFPALRPQWLHKPFRVSGLGFGFPADTKAHFLQFSFSVG